MAKKPSTLKNPLAQAFGMALHRQLSGMPKTPDDVAETLGIGSSFYRLVESGTNNLHVSKAVPLASAFDGTLDFDGVCKILMSISYMEASGVRAIAAERGSEGTKNAYADALKTAAHELAVYDPEKLGLLLEPFIKNKFFDEVKSVPSDAIADKIQACRLDEKVVDFLNDYENFGKPPEQVHSEFIKDFFDDVPTIYLDFLREARDGLLKLPVRVGFEGLWDWENRNKSHFSTLIAIVKTHRLVTSQENLDRYKYGYLWEPKFKDVRILYMDDGDVTNVKQLFTQSLRRSLEKANETDLLRTFDEKLAKVSFKHCPSKAFPFTKIQSSDSKNMSALDSVKAHDSDHNSAWVFTMQNKSNLGFTSYISTKNALLVVGRSLAPSASLKLLKKLNELWKNC